MESGLLPFHSTRSGETFGIHKPQESEALPLAGIEASRRGHDFYLSKRVSTVLPSLTVGTLRECQRPKALPISDCVHLSNPATGSTSLANAFKSELSLRNLSFTHAGISHRRSFVFPSKSGISGFDLMHTHAFGVQEVQAYLRHKRLPAARCFVLSLRDPAARLMSAFRDSYVHAERMTVALGSRKNRTASQLVSRLRHLFDYPQRPLPSRAPPGASGGSGSDAEQAARNASFAAFLYAHSAGFPRWLYNWHYPGPVNGSMFLTSQLAYLRGLECSHTEIHLLCQERFDDDWLAFLSAKRSVPEASSPQHSSTSGQAPPPPKLWHSHRRSTSREHPLMKFAIARAALSADEQEFVRVALYPWDTALHSWACGTAADRARIEKELDRFADAAEASHLRRVARTIFI